MPTTATGPPCGVRDAPLEPALDRLLDRPWRVSPSVSVRPESFGALLYHFGTRRLSFLKDRRLLAVVERLPHVPTARQACAEAGLSAQQLPQYARALSTLAATDMIQERPVPENVVPQDAVTEEPQ